jgi:colicin import membrane protein
MLSSSVLLHLLLLGIITRFSLLPGPLPVAQVVYEVDLLNLPVADPQAGNPAAPTGSPTAAPPPTAPPAATMTLPAVKPPPKVSPPVSTRDADARHQSEALEQLQRKADARHEAEALEQLRRKLGSGQSGVPAGRGTESGSDYTSYLHSRLVDAFKTTITYQSKDPEVAVRLIIDGKGRIVANRIERSSGDKLFDDAAQRAIAKAARQLAPPPGGASFEHGFVFRPQGIGK